MVTKLKVFINPTFIYYGVNNYRGVKRKRDHICCENNKYANKNNL